MIIRKGITGFVEFIREQGVVGFAIGFILGGGVSSVVKALVDDIINPLVGMLFGSVKTLAMWKLGPVALGDFLSVLLNFLILAAVVYFVFKGLRLDRLDIKKEL
jgi:large conductance mechanosensitive channel